MSETATIHVNGIDPALFTPEVIAWYDSLKDCPTCTSDRDFDDPAECPTCFGDRWV